jgi:penicillin amidase
MLTQLKNWNYDMDKDLAAPTIYRKWRDFYIDFTFDDELNFAGAPISPQLNILEKLTRDEPNSKWFNDINTPETENRTHIILKALNYTIDSLLDFYNTADVKEWKWGKIHQLLFSHIVPGFESFNKGPYEGDGEGFTVNPAGANIRNGVGYARGGASERMIVDFSDMKNSISAIPSGQRAISSSKHYSDQLEQLFLQGKYHRQYFYNTIEDYPKNHIESQINIIAGMNYESEFIVTTFLIIGFVVGIICVSVGWYKKDLILPKLKELKEKLRGDRNQN